MGGGGETVWSGKGGGGTNKWPAMGEGLEEHFFLFTPTPFLSLKKSTPLPHTRKDALAPAL
jgi:hypothetical protein